MIFSFNSALVIGLNLCSSPTSKLCKSHILMLLLYRPTKPKCVAWLVPNCALLINFFILVSPKPRSLTFTLTFNYLLSAHRLTGNVLDARNQEIKKTNLLWGRHTNYNFL